MSVFYGYQRRCRAAIFCPAAHTVCELKRMQIKDTFGENVIANMKRDVEKRSR